MKLIDADALKSVKLYVAQDDTGKCRAFVNAVLVEDIIAAPTVCCEECDSRDICYIGCEAQRLDGYEERGVCCAYFERRES